MGHRFRTLLVSVLAIALFAWFLRHANLGDVWRSIRGARVDLLALTLVPVLLMMVVRAVRWQYLLTPLGRARFRTAFRTTMIGFAASNILPARAGEFLRPYLLARQEGLSATSTFATVVIERVLDMVAVLALLGVFVFLGGVSAGSATMRAVEVSAAVAGVVAVVLLALMWILASHPERIGSVVFRTARHLPTKLANRLSKAARTFSEGLAVVKAPGDLGFAFAWSLVLWVTIGAQAYLVSRAFGIVLPVTGGFLLQVLLVVGVAVPTPGGVGGFHEAYRIGVTTFFGASNVQAVAAGLVLHAVSFIPVTFLGGLFMMQDGLSLRGLPGLSSAARTEELPSTDEVSILRTSGR